MKEKVVLAYSGGLDTTAIIPWLKETFNYDVICCCIDCGQGEELDGLEERAKLSGAAKLYIEDIVDDFADNYIVPCVQAHALYEDEYLLELLWQDLAIAKRLVEIASKENAVAICHGATGKGNDQIRFELGITALAPDIKIIAPWSNDRSGLCSHVKTRLITVKHMESTFHSMQNTATAVTVTYGISATKVWNLRILPTSQTTMTFSYVNNSGKSSGQSRICHNDI